MTTDKQPDRTAASLAFVSDRNYPENLDHTPDQPITDEQNTEEHHQKANASPTNAFEGFGSFSSLTGAEDRPWRDVTSATRAARPGPAARPSSWR